MLSACIMKKIAIFGSTGSIGTQTLEVLRAFPGEFEVVGLTAFKNADLLKEQAEEFVNKNGLCKPKNGAKSLHVQTFLAPTTAQPPPPTPAADIIVTAPPGFAGLEVSLAAEPGEGVDDD